MSGKVREFDSDWRVATLNHRLPARLQVFTMLWCISVYSTDAECSPDCRLVNFMLLLLVNLFAADMFNQKPCVAHESAVHKLWHYILVSCVPLFGGCESIRDF